MHKKYIGYELHTDFTLYAAIRVYADIPSKGFARLRMATTAGHLTKAERKSVHENTTSSATFGSNVIT